MAVVHEVANVPPAEVHTNRHARVMVAPISVPVWNLDYVEELSVDAWNGLATIDLKVVLRQHQEVDLMNVELMIFRAAVLDGPVLNAALRGDDRGRIVGAEKRGVAPSMVIKKLVGLSGLLGSDSTSEK
jgi:hypothetical protein